LRNPDNQQDVFEPLRGKNTSQNQPDLCHMNAESLKKIHRYSGIVLATFFLFHVINHLCAWGGADLHIRVMKLFRIVYRFPPVEIVLLLSALVQVISGLILVWKKGFRKNGYDVMQVASGLYLSFFLFYHIRAVMLGRYAWNVETDFHFAAWGVKNTPADLFFIPYYSLSVLCVFIHLACVHRQKSLMLNQANASHHLPGRHALAIMLTGVVVTILILTSFIRA
jgi:hypothetical protein